MQHDHSRWHTVYMFREKNVGLINDLKKNDCHVKLRGNGFLQFFSIVLFLESRLSKMVKPKSLISLIQGCTLSISTPTEPSNA